MAGGFGGDTLAGDSGDDKVNGGAGRDGAGAEVIRDFTWGIDKLDLSAPHLTFHVGDSFLGVANQATLIDAADGGSLQIDTDSDRNADHFLRLADEHWVRPGFDLILQPNRTLALLRPAGDHLAERFICFVDG